MAPSDNDDPIDELDQQRELLVEAFALWHVESMPDDQGLMQSDVDMFLSWRINYSSGDLRRFHADDLDEFLLSWCPRKLSVAPTYWMPVIEGVAAYLRFLTESGLGGMTASRGEELIAHTHSRSEAFLDAMASPNNFGLGKSLMMGPGFAGADIDFDDPASIQAAMDRFNALPFEERKALTDPGLEQQFLQRSVPRGLDLPPLRRPSNAAVQLAAQASPLVRMITGLRDHLGPKGKSLTQKGNLKLADCKVLVAQLETGDRYDEKIGDRVHRTTSVEDLPVLLYIVEAAVAAHAVRKVRNVLVPVKKWPTEAVPAAIQAANAMFDIGLLAWGWSSGEYGDRIRETLDDGVPYLLAPAVAFDTWILFDDLLPVAMGAVQQLPGRPAWYGNNDRLEETVSTYLQLLFKKLVLAGLCILEDERFKMTPFGRHVMIDRLIEAGFRVTELPSVTNLSAIDLLASIDDASTMPADELWTEWQPTWTAPQKVEALLGALNRPTTATTRSAVMTLLGIDSAVAEPYVRALLDTVYASHATAWLLAHEFDLPPGIEPESIGVGVACDFLWQVVDQDGPHAMCELLINMINQELMTTFVDDLGRCDFAEVADVLGAIGSAFPDRRVAKAAKVALHKFKSRRGHRSS